MLIYAIHKIRQYPIVQSLVLRIVCKWQTCFDADDLLDSSSVAMSSFMHESLDRASCIANTVLLCFSEPRSIAGSNSVLLIMFAKADA